MEILCLTRIFILPRSTTHKPSISGNSGLAEGGTLLSPIPQGMLFELWHQLNIEEVRKDVQKVLSEFLADWDKGGKK